MGIPSTSPAMSKPSDSRSTIHCPPPPAGSTQSNADTDLIAAARHVEAHHPVQSNGRKQHRKRSEDGREPRDQRLLAHEGLHLIVHSANLKDGQVGVNA